MQDKFVKYFVLFFHIGIITFVISTFFVNRWFDIRDENEKFIFTAGLNKYCNNENCSKYENPSSILF